MSALIEQKHRPQENTPDSRCGLWRAIFETANVLAIATVYCLIAPANIIFVMIYSRAGSVGYFGRADSAHSDPDLTGTPDSRKYTRDDE